MNKTLSSLSALGMTAFFVFVLISDIGLVPAVSAHCTIAVGK
jgi:hypothetical protein